jgi:hypothetical protein
MPGELGNLQKIKELFLTLTPVEVLDCIIPTELGTLTNLETLLIDRYQYESGKINYVLCATLEFVITNPNR